VPRFNDILFEIYGAFAHDRRRKHLPFLPRAARVRLGWLVRKYTLLFHGGTRRKVNLSAHRVLIETLMNRSALFGGWLYRNDVGYPDEVDARRGGERTKETTRSAVVDVLERVGRRRASERRGP